MIEAIIFDIGNVLLKFNYLIAAERLRLINGLHELPERDPLVAAKNLLEAGQISREEFLHRARASFAHREDEASFLEIWEDIFHPNFPMVEFARSLHRRLPLYLLSNISCIHREYIFRKYDFMQLFDRGAYSYELGCLKPEPIIYERAAQLLRIDPANTLFIDDMPENIEAAQNFGLQTRLYDFRKHDDFLQSLTGLGLTFTSNSPKSNP
jgi:putative hydrolase of the HAD superfamily